MYFHPIIVTAFCTCRRLHDTVTITSHQRVEEKAPLQKHARKSSAFLWNETSIRGFFAASERLMLNIIRWPLLFLHQNTGEFQIQTNTSVTKHSRISWRYSGILGSGYKYTSCSMYLPSYRDYADWIFECIVKPQGVVQFDHRSHDLVLETANISWVD